MHTQFVKTIVVTLILALLATACNLPGAATAVPTPVPGEIVAETSEVEVIPGEEVLVEEPTPAETPLQETVAVEAEEAQTTPAAEEVGIPSKEVVLTIVKPDGSTLTYTEFELKKMPRSKFNQGKKYFEGPIVMEVLKAAGIENYKELVVSGEGGDYTFTKSQITIRVLFDFSNKGSISLVAAYLTKDKWVKQVTQIKVIP